MEEYFMNLAINEAWKYQLLTYPNPAVGATVVKNNKVLSIGVHKKAGEPHAEVNALKLAYLDAYPNSNLKDLVSSLEIHNFLIQNHNDYFKECEIYVTLEPCNHTGKTPACASLLESISIKKVYIGTLDPNKEASGGVSRLKQANISVISGICQQQTDELLYPFKMWQQNNFFFFKLAMREDGSIDGGYITTQDSLSYVHNIREKLDMMIISGKTVRDDRPTLDSRFSSDNKPPDLLIYSKEKDFDKTIPLFSIENRDVTIIDNLNILKNKQFAMFEGGYTLLDVVKPLCHYLVLFVSHKAKFDKKINLDKLGFEKVYSYFINNDDEILFLKNNNFQ